MKLNRIHINTLILLSSALLFIPFLGTVPLFDWDEINFAECAREMLVTQDYLTVQINFRPFWEKPPLFVWLSAICMNLFVINEFSARLPDAICGIITLLVVFNIGSKLYDKKMGLLWALCFASSILPQFYFKSGIIDPWFNLFIFLGAYYLIIYTNYSGTERPAIKPLFLSGLFIGLAVLTKGPVAVLIIGLTTGCFWALKRFHNMITVPHLLFYILIVASVGGLWFLTLILNDKTYIISEFFDYQIRLFRTRDSDHGGPFFYHFIVLFIGCFPASTFAIRGFKSNPEDTPFQQHFRQWMLILFWVVLILFSFVKTKILHYSSACYFPLTFLAAYGIYHLTNGTFIWKKWMHYSLIISGGITATGLSLLPVADAYKKYIIGSGVIHDDFVIENMKANVHWMGWEWLTGFGVLLSTLLFVFMIKRQNYMKGITTLLVTNLLLIHLTSLIIVPKIELYTQAAAIEFYRSVQQKNCYVETLGFKSYAHLFYTKKMPPADTNSYSKSWLISENIDKDAYFVSKITEEELNKTYPIKELYRKNGFIFYVRNAGVKK